MSLCCSGLQLPNITDIPQTLADSIAVLFGSSLPEDIVFDDVTPADPALADFSFVSSFDEGFCGHFSIPGDPQGAAADFGDVLASADPFSLMESSLLFKPVREDLADGEIVIFSPGLNTLHAPDPGLPDETTTPQRLQHYVNTLGAPMVQVHMGTDFDQGEAVLELDDLFFMNILKAQTCILESYGIMPFFTDNTMIWTDRQRDYVETVLSSLKYVVPLLQTHMVQMLELNEVEKKQLVFLPYSRSNTEYSRAIETYKAGYLARNADKEPALALADVEAILRDTLIVMSFGNTDRSWPDGPLYVHMSAISNRTEGGTDPLTLLTGVTQLAPVGAGRDAVFLHHDGVFSGFDSHNFGAAGAAALRLVMKMNDFQTFRGLYSALAGDMEIRMPTFEETAAAVVLTGGPEWVWAPSEAYDGLVLPSFEDAAALVGEFL